MNKVIPHLISLIDSSPLVAKDMASIATNWRRSLGKLEIEQKLQE